MAFNPNKHDIVGQSVVTNSNKTVVDRIGEADDREKEEAVDGQYRWPTLAGEGVANQYFEKGFQTSLFFIFVSILIFHPFLNCKEESAIFF